MHLQYRKDSLCKLLIQYFDRITAIRVNVVLISAEDTHPKETTTAAFHELAK